MSGPRAYTRSTIYALAALGQGTCYWPKPPCNVPIVVHIEGRPVTNLEIAHIRAAEPNGPRYVPDMSDGERRAWANLILLCTPHHNWVDKIKPNDYSIKDLERWKSEREAGGLAKLRGLSDLTEDRLQEMLTYSMKEARKEIHEILAKHKPIDPDAAMLLSHAARHLNMDTAEIIYHASRMLAPALNEYAGTLDRASRVLAPALNEYAGTLDHASRVLTPALNEYAEKVYYAARHLPGLVEQLDHTVRELRRLQGNM